MASWFGAKWGECPLAQYKMMGQKKNEIALGERQESRCVSLGRESDGLSRKEWNKCKQSVQFNAHSIIWLERKLPHNRILQDHHGRQNGFLGKFIGEARTLGSSLKARELDRSMEREHAMPCNFKKGKASSSSRTQRTFFKKGCWIFVRLDHTKIFKKKKQLSENNKWQQSKCHNNSLYYYSISVCAYRTLMNLS
ncbi:uncharacterized protein J3R85_011541 [Psidium guajava]|nr:uncharacterized protein J3R85_011541 [Psidium guajava]